ncbi:MAG: 7-carboxy-7-deazaguanine synthase QueE [Planctomycetia bacterium]|nr:7-carboxy-7-deazaguanine synthase QueE [Planctomycetia bacterium]
MRIAEIYRSTQGEGLLTGTESVFVRASGCNLRCWFCDTPFASWRPEGQDLPLDAILAQVREWDTPHVVLTGGEPMLFSELIPLTASLRDAGRHLTIETAGTLYLPVACDLMSISPKMSNSTPSVNEHATWSRRHDRVRHAPQIVSRLMDEYTYQLKFVIETPADCEEMQQYLKLLPEVDFSRVLLMPQGVDAEPLSRVTEWLEPYCRQEGFRFCPRRQIEWFGLVRGT